MVIFKNNFGLCVHPKILTYSKLKYLKKLF